MRAARAAPEVTAAGNALVTDALIKHRDGIVGNWLGATTHPVQRALEDPANLQSWEPWVRAASIQFDLLSNLHVTRHAETFTYAGPTGTVTKSSNRSVTVWHMRVTNTGPGNSPKATSSRLATIIRPTPAIFKQQLKFLDTYADLREDRASEIIAQMTPPVAFWSSIAYLHPDRTKKTLELLDAALRLVDVRRAEDQARARLPPAQRVFGAGAADDPHAGARLASQRARDRGAHGRTHPVGASRRRPRATRWASS